MNDQRTPNNRTKTQKPVTAQYLENAALYYLQRFASSSANLRRVLMGKVERSARAHGTDREEGAALVEALIERYLRSGLLDDKAYAEAKAASLHRRGTSTRGIRGKLALKGLETDHIDAALETVDEETPAIRNWPQPWLSRAGAGLDRSGHPGGRSIATRIWRRWDGSASATRWRNGWWTPKIRIISRARISNNICFRQNFRVALQLILAIVRLRPCK